MFDLRHDPAESRNLLLRAGQCAANFDAHGPELLRGVVDKAAFAAHCQQIAGAGGGGGGGGAALAGAGAGASKAAAPGGGGGGAVGACVERYHQAIVQKLAYMLPHLSAFVRHGDKPMRAYLAREGKTRGCGVPDGVGAGPVAGAALVPFLDFGADCFQSKQCSAPLF